MSPDPHPCRRCRLCLSPRLQPSSHEDTLALTIEYMCGSGLFTLKHSGTNIFHTDGNGGGKQHVFK